MNKMQIQSYLPLKEYFKELDNSNDSNLILLMLKIAPKSRKTIPSLFI